MLLRIIKILYGESTALSLAQNRFLINVSSYPYCPCWQRSGAYSQGAKSLYFLTSLSEMWLSSSLLCLFVLIVLIYCLFPSTRITFQRRYIARVPLKVYKWIEWRRDRQTTMGKKLDITYMSKREGMSCVTDFSGNSRSITNQHLSKRSS